MVERFNHERGGHVLYEWSSRKWQGDVPVCGLEMMMEVYLSFNFFSPQHLGKQHRQKMEFFVTILLEGRNSEEFRNDFCAAPGFLAQATISNIMDVVWTSGLIIYNAVDKNFVEEVPITYF